MLQTQNAATDPFAQVTGSGIQKQGTNAPRSFSQNIRITRRVQGNAAARRRKVAYDTFFETLLGMITGKGARQ
jgi:hypothetical protein